MKARVSYNDFIGTSAADISDGLGEVGGNDLDKIADYFKLNKERFEIVGLSIYGTTDFHISLICVDKIKSNSEKDHIVSMSVDIENRQKILHLLFKRFHVVLHDKFDKKYSVVSYDEEVRYEEFHTSDNK